jgi:hypothetical protein
MMPSWFDFYGRPLAPPRRTVSEAVRWSCHGAVLLRRQSPASGGRHQLEWWRGGVGCWLVARACEPFPVRPHVAITSSVRDMHLLSLHIWV